MTVACWIGLAAIPLLFWRIGVLEARNYRQHLMLKDSGYFKWREVEPTESQTPKE